MPIAKNQKAVDLTGAYFLHLEAKGQRSRAVRVQFVDQAQAVFADFRDNGDDGFMLGASQMRSDCGKITDAHGRLVATICYNGRVMLPSGRFMDGMEHDEWMTFCRPGRDLHVDLSRQTAVEADGYATTEEELAEERALLSSKDRAVLDALPTA
jgi:hypothetical protein